jgi:hypothetical protein
MTSARLANKTYPPHPKTKSRYLTPSLPLNSVSHLTMSSLDPHPATQITAINNRYLKLETSILDYRKLVERTMVPEAKPAISDGDNAQPAMDGHLDRAQLDPDYGHG